MEYISDLNCPTFQAQIARLSFIIKNWGGRRPPAPPPPRTPMMFFHFEGDGCHVAVVDGRYSYHHYMQDNFDDNVSARVSSCS